MELLSAEDCKKVISKLGFELGVSPRLVISRLLSEEDKVDMKGGCLPIEALRCHIEVWMGNDMPDYVKGHEAP
jgi:hypothetical protein